MNRIRAASGLLALGLVVLPGPLSAQRRAADVDPALAAWRAEQGESWRGVLDPETGWLQMLHGGRTRAEAAPLAESEFAEHARAQLVATHALHGVDDATLVLESTQFLPLGQIGSTDKFTVRFRQEIGGVRVVGGFVNVLFGASGAMLSVQSSGLPGLEGFDVEPTLAASHALEIAVADFAARHGLRPTETSAPELVIEQVVAKGGRAPRLCWRIDAQWLPTNDAAAEPVGDFLSVDARTGELVLRTPSVHFFGVTGTVSALCSPGVLPDIASNPEQAQLFRHLNVTSSAGNATTDAAGTFTIAGANSPTQVTFRFQGPFANVVNSAGASYTLAQTLQPGVANTVTLNPSSIASVTAQANAFRCVNLLRDFIRATNPTDSRGDFVAVANVDVSGTCNAYYNGGSINFFPAGGGCANTSYSTVVSHEHGHWMNDRYSTGNGPDGMGEGNADVWAMYIYDTPVVGQNFSGGSFIRTGLNTRPFCGDASPACNGEVHVDGEVWMGAAWKIRANLNATLGNAQGDLAANTLFLAWMNAYNQGGIRSVIENQWLTLDDDDGVLDNGTPHFADIDNGFRAQGFPGITAPCPSPTTFCASSPNSVGAGARISWIGSTRVSRNDFTLLCTGARPNTSGLFFYGQTTTQVPFGNGVRCVENPFFRLPARQANIFGDLLYTLNLSSLPTGGQISAGQTWKFQCYYRDIAGGGAFFNTSDALSTTWCP
ncbi:MAG: hypothetical protein IPJ77_14380 [Planctomycetes bacterium]|nr:hypothetical protein [Planctomycetota bacterium]